MPFKNTYKNILLETQQGADLRRPYLEKIQALRDGRQVLSFFISFYSKHALIPEDADMIEEALCNSDTTKGVSLILDAPGGDGLTAERIIHICRNYSKGDFEVIIPARAKSAATMVCLGSDRIVMSSTSELGPIDPQIPIDLEGNGQRQWVAVHYITKSYDDLFQGAVSSQGRIEPYLQQLSKFNAVHVESLRAASKLSEDIAIRSLQRGMLTGKSEDEIRDLIKPFTDPELTMSHGRGINLERARECGLDVERVDTDSELWRVIWGLYLRSKHVVDNTPAKKLVETLDGSYVAT